MADVLSDQYWQNKFDITAKDLQRIRNWMAEESRAFTLTELARRIVRGRLRYGPVDNSPSVLSDDATGTPVRLWDPARQWKPKDRVIVVSAYTDELFVSGEIIDVRTDQVDINADGIERLLTYLRAAPSSAEAIAWHRVVREAVEQKEKAAREKQLDRFADENVELVLSKHGERVFTSIYNALKGDQQWITYEDRWFRGDILEDVPPPQLQVLYKNLLLSGQMLAPADLFGYAATLSGRPWIILVAQGTPERSDRPLRKPGYTRAPSMESHSTSAATLAGSSW
jgi:hypothetical protein